MKVMNIAQKRWGKRTGEKKKTTIVEQRRERKRKKR